MLRFVSPCLPIKSAAPPSGPLWLHEIKHDGFRIIACKDGPDVRLYSRPGNDLTNRFPLIVESLSRLRCKLCWSMARRSPGALTGARISILFDTDTTTKRFSSTPLIYFDLAWMTCGAIHW